MVNLSSCKLLLNIFFFNIYDDDIQKKTVHVIKNVAYMKHLSLCEESIVTTLHTANTSFLLAFTPTSHETVMSHSSEVTQHG